MYKYPWDLFVFGLFDNLIRCFWLWIPGIILILIGIFKKKMLLIGTFLVVSALIFSFVQQMRIRQAFLTESQNPDFQEIQEVISEEGDWRENLHDYLNKKHNQWILIIFQSMKWFRLIEIMNKQLIVVFVIVDWFVCPQTRRFR